MTDRGDELHYNEEIRSHPVFGVFMVLAIAAISYLVAVIPGEFPRIVLIFVVILIGFLYMSFSTLKVSITSSRLRVGFGIIEQVIKLDNIDIIETKHPPWYWYGGLGIRFGWDWSIGFVQNFKRGVIVTPRRGRRLFFSTNNPEAVVNIVNDLLQKMRKTSTDA